MTVTTRDRIRHRRPITRWVPTCRLDDLEVERGRAALIGERQVALFRLTDDEVVAVDHHDPFSGANVIANGIVGVAGETVKVTSPMYKQAFDLRTGRCLDDPEIRLGVFPVRIVDDAVEVATNPV